MIKRKPQDIRNCVCFNIRKVARAVTQFYDGILRPSGIQGTQFNLIAVISAFESSTISRLSEFLVMDRTTLARNLKPLEKQGLIKIVSGEDQRTRIVTLTEEGKNRFSVALPLWENAQSEILDKFGKDSWMLLMSDLQKVISIIKQH